VSASDKDSAGDLLIQEVDEELRRDQYHQLWKRYGNYVIAAVIGVVLLVAGYQGWQAWQSKQRQEEAAKFGAAQTLAAQGKTSEALEALAKLGADSRSGFAITARMRRAQLLTDAGDVAGATATYEQIIGSSSPKLYRDLAILKAALLSLDGVQTAEMEGRVASLAVAGNPWYYSAVEVMALVAQKKGDTKQATLLYKQLADDAQAPSGIRARAAEMLAILSPASEKAKG
jgi:hypothetical protein